MAQVMSCGTITWTNVDSSSSVKSNDSHLMAISQEITQPSVTQTCNSRKHFQSLREIGGGLRDILRRKDAQYKKFEYIWGLVYVYYMDWVITGLGKGLAPTCAKLLPIPMLAYC